MTKTLFRERGKRWVEMEVRLKDGQLSVCGAEGEIVKATRARKMTKEYWESFLKDSPEEMVRIAKDYRRYTPKSAAKFIVDSDGRYHGLDVHHEDGNRVYLTESCGQIRETLAEWFPDIYPTLAPYHLNDLHAECEHQEARGETYQSNPGAECPDCGYKLGSGWTKRELPAAIVAAVETL